MKKTARKATSAAAAGPVICPTCGQPIAAGQPHARHGYSHLKMQLDGYLKPGQSLHRNMLFDALYEFFPKDSRAQVQVYNYEIAPGGFTNWHIHTGATFYLSLQGLFEGHFEEGVLIKAKPGEVYSEPIGKIHRGHNPHAEVTLQGIGFAVTAPHMPPIINVEPPAWAK
jgi:quercetin dioxygenase-like cupin family protein